MHPAYDVLTIDLSTARTRERIVDNGRMYDSVVALSNPAGAGASLAFGEALPLVPLLTQGQGFEACPGADEGLYLSNIAGAGFLVLLVTYAGIGVTP